MPITPEENTCYKDKIGLMNGEDPNSVPKESFTSDPECLPSIRYPDIYNYLILNTSAYAKDDLKAYKGLEDYNKFVFVWVRDVEAKAYGEHRLVKAEVKYILFSIEHQSLKGKFTKIKNLIN